MNVENLTQYNSIQFLRLFGLYVKKQRILFDLTLEELSAITNVLATDTLSQIEDGLYLFTELEFQTLVEQLKMEEIEILNLAKITQVQSIMELSREINEHFPK